MDTINLTQVAIAFGALLVLLGVFWYGARLFSGGSRVGKMRPNQRIGVIETTIVDGGRRLVLVRRDDTEHLLLLGNHGDLVIESNIPMPEGSQQAAKAWSKLRGDEPPARPVDPRQAEPRQTDLRQTDIRPGEPRPSEQSGGWPTLRMPGKDTGRDGGRDR